MASKGTPTKLYKKRPESTTNISRCRLCDSVVDPDHSKVLFRSQNETVLRNVEIICDEKLPYDSELPRFICRPCERRLKNAVEFRETVKKTQRILHENVRRKRCVELSPSVQTTAKVRATGSTRRRSIDFNINSGDQQTRTSHKQVKSSIPHCILSLNIMSIFVDYFPLLFVAAKCGSFFEYFASSTMIICFTLNRAYLHVIKRKVNIIK